MTDNETTNKHDSEVLPKKLDFGSSGKINPLTNITS